MKKKISDEKVEQAVFKFFATAKEVVCPKCGQKYMTIENDLTCYECHTNIRYGVVLN